MDLGQKERKKNTHFRQEGDLVDCKALEEYLYWTQDDRVQKHIQDIYSSEMVKCCIHDLPKRVQTVLLPFTGGANSLFHLLKLCEYPVQITFFYVHNLFPHNTSQELERAKKFIYRTRDYFKASHCDYTPTSNSSTSSTSSGSWKIRLIEASLDTQEEQNEAKLFPWHVLAKKALDHSAGLDWILWTSLTCPPPFSDKKFLRGFGYITPIRPSIVVYNNINKDQAIKWNIIPTAIMNPLFLEQLDNIFWVLYEDNFSQNERLGPNDLEATLLWNNLNMCEFQNVPCYSQFQTFDDFKEKVLAKEYQEDQEQELDHIQNFDPHQPKICEKCRFTITFFHFLSTQAYYKRNENDSLRFFITYNVERLINQDEEEQESENEKEARVPILDQGTRTKTKILFNQVHFFYNLCDMEHVYRILIDPFDMISLTD